MADGIRWVGLDVHAHESTIAIFDQGTGELSTARMVGRPHQLLERLMEVPVPARMVYEAGPTGYGLARRARAWGIEMSVCAPGRTERRPGDRIKTDKRDAVRLARLLAAGELAIVTVPSLERERLRDLVRCREDIRADLMRAAPAREVPVAPRGVLGGAGACVVASASRVARRPAVRRSRVAGDDGRLPARARRARRPP